MRNLPRYLLTFQAKQWLLQRALGLCLLGFFGAELQAEEPAAWRLASGEGKQWYKGNLHTHSLWSDGDDYLEAIALWYRDHDYQFLSFTDHNVLANKERWVDVAKNKGGEVAFQKLQQKFPDWVETRVTDDVTEVRLRTFDEVADRMNVPGKFLLIQGEEISDQFERRPLHMNATNLKELLTPRGGSSMAEALQNNVNALLRQREQTGQAMMIHLNHPNFRYAITAEDMMRVIGEKFFEVYNGHPGVHNQGDEQHASTERIWDIVLTKRLAEFDLPVMFGLATDDGHSYHSIPSRASEPGRGWVMVLADQLTPETLIQELEAGNFYSSSGVTLKSIERTAEHLQVVIDPAPDTYYTIEFVGTRTGYDPQGVPHRDEQGKPLPVTLIYSPQIGEVLETCHGPSARYEFQGDEIYVRARITASTKHPNPSELHDHEMAWTQPIVLKTMTSEK